MIDTWSVVILIVGIVLSFAGAFLAMMAAQQRKPIEQLRRDVDSHGNRIANLERRDAGREQQIKNIMLGIEEIKDMFRRHEDKA